MKLWVVLSLVLCLLACASGFAQPTTLEIQRAQIQAERQQACWREQDQHDTCAEANKSTRVEWGFWGFLGGLTVAALTGGAAIPMLVGAVGGYAGGAVVSDDCPPRPTCDF